ncbi:hypothetical protein B0H17DRAFT_1100746, partial [Mycena rosella]
ALAIGKTLATGHVARDSDPDAPFEGASTRQRTRSRTTSLKAMATCLTVTNSPHALTAVALIQHKDPHAVPVFVATHTAIEDNGLASTTALKPPATAGEAAVRVQKQSIVSDYVSPAAPSVTLFSLLTASFQLAALYNEPGAIVWESAVPDVPHIVSISSSHASHQALFAQRHAYKAVVSTSPTRPRISRATPGSSLRAYYDSPIVHAKLDKLYLFAWTDPAAPFLEIWRTCFMVSVYESENPFRGVPHIPALVPEQDERFLTVSTCYMQVAEEEEDTDDKWYCGDDEEEEVPCVVHWSESEEESDDARTALAALLAAPHVPYVYGPQGLHARRRALGARGAVPQADAYRPLAADYKPLWTGNAMLPISPGADADDSGDDQSQYMDALDQAQDSEAESHYVDAEQPEETDGDQYQSEDDYRYHAHHIPRPSCDIFLNDEDGDPPQLPRGKANIPAGKLDWFDLLDDSDLGSLEWPAPRTNNDT